MSSEIKVYPMIPTGQQMTMRELRTLCLEAIAEQPDDAVILVKMSGRWGKTDVKQLAGMGSPFGLIRVAINDGVIVAFKASEVLRHLDRMEVANSK